MVAETNLCGSDSFVCNIDLHKDSRLAKVRDLVSGYLSVKTEAVNWK